jgi:hypothetical protein
MTLTSVALAVFGCALVMVPDLAVASVSPGLDRTFLPVVQLLGSSLLAFGYLNWMSRRAILGGVLGRPIVAGNFTHGLVGTLILLRLLSGDITYPVCWALCSLYLAYTIAFGRLLFSRPPGIQNPSAL